MFPDHLYKTLPNLIYFVLQHSSMTLRLHTGLSICSRACIMANLASTVQRIHSLHRALSVLVKSREMLQRKIRLYTDRTMPEELPGNTISVLEWYKNVLAKRIWIKHLQLKEARHLHNVLLSTSGPYIERHKLSAILKRYRAYSRWFVWMDNDDMKEELSAEIISSSINRRGRDEL